MGKTDREEDPDGWRVKPRKGRGKRNKENAYDLASLLPSSTRAGTAYQRSDITKVVRCGSIYSFWCPDSPDMRKENTAQPDTGAIAAQAVANAAAEEAAAFFFGKHIYRSSNP